MFIPYNNGHHTKMECFTSPNMSGNIGNHDQNSQLESQEFFDQLSKNAKNGIYRLFDMPLKRLVALIFIQEFSPPF